MGNGTDRYIYMTQPWVASFYTDCENTGLKDWRNPAGGNGPDIIECKTPTPKFCTKPVTTAAAARAEYPPPTHTHTHTHTPPHPPIIHQTPVIATRHHHQRCLTSRGAGMIIIIIRRVSPVQARAPLTPARVTHPPVNACLIPGPNKTAIAMFKHAVAAGDIFFQAFPHNAQPGTYDASLFEASLDMAAHLADVLGVRQLRHHIEGHFSRGS